TEVLRAVGGPTALKYSGPVRSLMQALKVNSQALADTELRPEVRGQLRQAVRGGWLRDIQAGLREAESRQNAPWLRMAPIALILGFILGELFGEEVFAIRHSPLFGDFPILFHTNRLDLAAILSAVVMGIFVAAVLLAAQWLLWRWQSTRMQRIVQTCIHEFQADFADD